MFIWLTTPFTSKDRTRPIYLLLDRAKSVQSRVSCACDRPIVSMFTRQRRHTYCLSSLTSLKMQKIRSLPRKCYSSCRGTIGKLKTRKYEQGISSVLLAIVCLLIIREMILEADNLATYRCYSECDREVQGNNSSCRRLCVLELPEDRAPRKASSFCTWSCDLTFYPVGTISRLPLCCTFKLPP